MTKDQVKALKLHDKLRFRDWDYERWDLLGEVVGISDNLLFVKWRGLDGYIYIDMNTHDLDDEDSYKYWWVAVDLIP